MRPQSTLKARSHGLRFPTERPLVMGIVNINDDSFSGDGTLDPVGALTIAERMLNEGADIIDIGAESARTNRKAISVEEEIRRLIPFLEAFPELAAGTAKASSERSQLTPPLLSINTWRSEVIEAALPVGGDLINDISGLPDGRNAELCAHHGAALLIMHTVGLPKIPHLHQRWENVIDAMDGFFEEKIALAVASGLSEEHLVIDPGIDFAKQKDDNLAIYRHMDRFHRFGRPILLPVSRKTVIGDVLGISNPAERDAGTVACVVRGARFGAQIIRVHHVAAAVQTLQMMSAVAS